MLFSTNGIGTTENLHPHTHNEPRYRFILFPKISLKCIIDLNVEHKTIKLSEDNIGESLHFWFGDDLFRYNTRIITIERKMSLNWITLIFKISALHKTLLGERKYKLQAGRKYLYNTSLIKCFFKIVCKEILKLSNMKTKKYNIKNGLEISRHLTKENIQMADKYMKRCSLYVL